MAKKKEVEISESTVEMTDSSVSAEVEVDVSATFDEGHSTMGKDAKERADEAARLAEQRAREETVRAAKKLAAEKATAEAEAKLAAEEAKKREEHAKRIAIRQATVEKAANKLKDQFKF